MSGLIDGQPTRTNDTAGRCLHYDVTCSADVGCKCLVERGESGWYESSWQESGYRNCGYLIIMKPPARKFSAQRTTMARLVKRTLANMGLQARRQGLAVGGARLIHS
jgi:hypothetical protein